jgi:membrane-associated phospholipid phosphatase
LKGPSEKPRDNSPEGRPARTPESGEAPGRQEPGGFGWRWGIIAVVLALLLWPFDGFFLRSLSALPIRDDLRLALQVAQQFGDLLTIIVTAILIWQLDPSRRRRLADLFVAAVIVAVVCLMLKVAIGRPRPEFATPDVFVGPFQPYEVLHQGEDHSIHSWQVHRRLAARLWSMPSSHTALAVALGVFLTALYPRLFWFCLVMVTLVGLGRVHFAEHYPTDVIVGAVTAFGISRWVVRERRGGALLDRWSVGKAARFERGT